MGFSMSVTDTKEFMRMETAADKLGVDQVKLVRMMQDKKMMVRLEFPVDRFENISWAVHGKKMLENELDEHLIGNLIVITLEGMEVLERKLLEGKTGIDLLDGLELCVETNKDVLGSIISRVLGLPPSEIPPNSENIIRAYSLPEALLEKIKEKRITQPRLVIQTHDFEQLKKPKTTIESIPENTIMKILTGKELGRIKALFVDLERQDIVPKGTADKVEDHFTVSTLKEPSPENAEPIAWLGKKYEGVHFLKTLSSSGWLLGSDKEQSCHFVFGDKPLKRTGYPIRDTEDLSRIKEILSQHLDLQKC